MVALDARWHLESDLLEELVRRLLEDVAVLCVSPMLLLVVPSARACVERGRGHLVVVRWRAVAPHVATAAPGLLRGVLRRGVGVATTWRRAYHCVPARLQGPPSAVAIVDAPVVEDGAVVLAGHAIRAASRRRRSGGEASGEVVGGVAGAGGLKHGQAYSSPV